MLIEVVAVYYCLSQSFGVIIHAYVSRVSPIMQHPTTPQTTVHKTSSLKIGAVDAASVALYDTSGATDPLWRLPNILKNQQGMVMCSAPATNTALCCSPDSVMAVVEGGRVLAAIETNGLKNHGAAMSFDGRFVAAATFTADVKVVVGF